MYYLVTQNTTAHKTFPPQNINFYQTINLGNILSLCVKISMKNNNNNNNVTRKNTDVNSSKPSQTIYGNKLDAHGPHRSPEEEILNILNIILSLSPHGEGRCPSFEQI